VALRSVVRTALQPPWFPIPDLPPSACSGSRGWAMSRHARLSSTRVFAVPRNGQSTARRYSQLLHPPPHPPARARPRPTRLPMQHRCRAPEPGRRMRAPTPAIPTTPGQAFSSAVPVEQHDSTSNSQTSPEQSNGLMAFRRPPIKRPTAAGTKAGTLENLISRRLRSDFRSFAGSVRAPYGIVRHKRLIFRP
jgi:hypothetical protein